MLHYFNTATIPALEQTIAQLECNTKQASLTGNTVKPLLSSHPRELAR